MPTSTRYDFFMSQIKHISDIKENDKTKISKVFYEGAQAFCILRICKNRDLSNICKALIEIKDSHISVIYDYIFENGNTYIIEEYINGKTVEEAINETGVFSEDQAAKIIVDICSALNILHRKNPPIVHNDINSSNIMLRDDGGIKLFDFDISRIHKKGQSQNTELFGTEEYAAPEHYGYGQSEPRTDIYSLGVTMHKMLAGNCLSAEHKTTYTGKLKRIIEKCIKAEPKDRYKSVSMLKRDLEKYINRKRTFTRKLVTTLIVLLALLFIIPLCFNSQETQKSNDGKTNPVTPSLQTNQKIEGDITSKETSSSENSDISANTSINTSSNIDSEKIVKNKYKLDGELKSMAVLNDGRFVYLEEDSDGCHLKTSFGEDYLLKDCAGSYTCDLIYDNYSNILYLLARDLNSSSYKLYSFDEKFNPLYLTTLFTEDRNIYGTYYFDPYASFFSDATMYCDVLENQFVDSKNWNDISSIDFSVFCIINDKLYRLSQDDDDNNFLQEIDFQNNIINEYEIPFEIEAGRWRDIIYNDNRNIFFAGSNQNKDYIYKFDGEKFEETICLNDYKYYTGLPYGDWCVTSNAIFMHDNESNVIKEFKLK